MLIDEGSKVLVETPSYLGALQAFSLFQPAFSAMQTDEHGIVTDALTPEQLAGARFMYCLPNFQNPTGRRMPLERRKALLEKAIAAGVPVVEDDPYGELCYSGEVLPSLLSMAPDNVIYMGSFSKVLAPGLAPGLSWSRRKNCMASWSRPNRRPTCIRLRYPAHRLRSRAGRFPGRAHPRRSVLSMPTSAS